jgi:hypothetical protein
MHRLPILIVPALFAVSLYGGTTNGCGVGSTPSVSLQVDATLYTNFNISGGPPASCAISGTFGSFSTTGYLITVTGSTETDPVIDFGLNFSGDGADPLVTLMISNPYVGGPYSTIYTTSSGTITDTNLNGSASALPPGSSTDIQVVKVNGSTVPTANPQNPGCNASGAPGFSQPCGPPTAMQNPAIFATSSTGTLAPGTPIPSVAPSVSLPSRRRAPCWGLVFWRWPHWRGAGF